MVLVLAQCSFLVVVQCLLLVVVPQLLSGQRGVVPWRFAKWCIGRVTTDGKCSSIIADAPSSRLCVVIVIH